MLIAACLFVSLCAPPKLAAVVAPSGSLEVTVNGKTRVLKMVWPHRDEPARKSIPPDAFRDAPREGLTFKGRKYTVSNNVIVDMATGPALTIAGPKKPDPTSSGDLLQGGIALEDSMVLVYGRMPVDGMVPPYIGVWAAVVGEKNGKLVQEKIVELNGLAGGHTDILAYRRGNELVVHGGYGAFGTIDLRTFEFKVLLPQDTHNMMGLYSDSGRIYRQDGRTLRVWDWGARKLKAVSRLEPHEWACAYGLGNDDLLVAPTAVALARSGKIYRVWPSRAWPSTKPFAGGLAVYLDRELGVGVTTVKKGLGETGAFLSLKDLSVFCRVTSKPK